MLENFYFLPISYVYLFEKNNVYIKKLYGLFIVYDIINNIDKIYIKILYIQGGKLLCILKLRFAMMKRLL